MTPAKASAICTGSAIAFFVLILAFNLGRLDAAASVRQCHQEQQLSFSTPFKGTLP